MEKAADSEKTNSNLRYSRLFILSIPGTINNQAYPDSTRYNITRKGHLWLKNIADFCSTL